MKICNECQKEFEQYSELWGGLIEPIYVKCPDICKECMAKGWIDAGSPEGMKALQDDGFTLGIESPIKRYDL